jgi:adenine deaminase
MVLVLLAPQLALAQWTAGQEGQLVIRGGWLFDGVGDERRRNTGLIIQDGKIAEVDAEVHEQVLSTAKVVDLAEADTILPGFIDLHAHYNLDLIDEGRVEEVVSNGIVFLANGVTSTWSAGEFFPERVIKFAGKWTPGPRKASSVSRSSRQRRAK